MVPYYSLILEKKKASVLSNLVQGAGSLSQRTKRYLQTLNFPYGKGRSTIKTFS